MPDRSSLTLAGVVGVLGFLLVTTVSTGRAERRREEPRKAELIRFIDERRSLVADLDEAVERLRSEAAAAQEQASRLSADDRRVAERTSLLARQAGTVALRGPGLVVELSNSARRPPSPDEAGAYRIHAADIQLVVNALFANGAEAVAINDSRLVSTTAIRAAGDTIVVNFRPLRPPYRIVAIGASKPRFESSRIANGFSNWTKLFGLGFDVRSERNLTVPGYTGRVAISSALPDPDAGRVDAPG